MDTSTNTPQTLELGTEEGVRDYLTTTEWAGAKIVSLSGGFTNFCYRLHLETPYRGHSTLILKHGKPYPKGLKSLELTLDRQMYEVEALQRVRAWLPADAFVTVPEVFSFDPTAHVIVMEDAGQQSVPLKAYMQTGRGTVPQAQKMGAEIGAFLGKMHQWGKDNEDILGVVRGYKQSRELSAWVFYGRLVSTVTGEAPLPKLQDPSLGVSESDIEAVRCIAEETTRKLTLEEYNTFLMGDFWPGNLMVRTDTEGNLERIYVLDWEIAKTGPTGMDIGQFSSEMHLLRRCNPETCKDTAPALLECLFKEYKAACPTTVADVKSAIVHWGAHATTLGARVDWGGKEITQQVVREGLRLLVDGYSADEAWLKGSPIGDLLWSVFDILIASFRLTDEL